MAVGELIVNIIGDMKDLHKVFSDVQTEIGNVGTKLQAAGAQISSAGSAMTSSITIPLVAVGAGIAAVSGQAVGFEKQMGEVFTLLPGLSKQGMGEMSQDALDFADDMGVLPKEVVPALYQAISAGIPKENVFDFLTTAQKAAVGGVTDLTTSVDGITSVVNAYGSDVLSATEASDLMFTAVKLGKTDFNQLSNSLYNVIPYSSAAGVAFGDVTAAIATLTSQGTPTAQATTQIRQAIVELSDSGSDVSLIFQEITGKTFKQFIAEGGNMNDALQLLEQYAKNSGVGVDELFGSVEAGAGVLGLTGKSSEKFAANIEEMGKSAGATEQAYSTMSQTTSKAIDEIKATLSVLIIELGQKFLPIIRDTLVPLIKNTLVPTIEKIIPIVEKIANGFGSLSAPVQVAVLAFTAFLAALGPILIVVGSVVSAFGTLATAVGTGGVLATAFASAKVAVAGFLTTLSGMALPIAAVIAVVAALALAWKNNWGDIQGKAKAVWDWLQSEMGKLVNRLEYYYHALVMAISAADLEKRWADIKNRLEYYYHALVMGASLLYSDLKRYWDQLVEALEPTRQNFSRIWDSIQVIWEAFKTSFIGSMSTLYNEVKKALDPLFDVLKTLWDQIKTYVAPALSALFVALGGSAIDNAKGKVSLFVIAINLFSGAIADLLDWVKRHPEITQFVAVIAAMAIAIPAALALVVAGVVYFVATVASKFIDAVRYAYDLYTGWRGHLENLKSYIAGLPGTISGYLQSLYNSVKSRFDSIVSAALSLLNSWRTHWTNFQSTLSSASSSINSVLSTLYNYINNVFNQVRTAAQTILNNWWTHWSNFQSTTQLASSTVNSILVTLYNYVNNVFNQVRTAASTILANWRTHWSNFQSATSSAASTLNSILGTLYNYVQTKFNQIRDAANSILNSWRNHWNNFQSATSSASSSLNSALSSMYSNVQSRFNSIRDSANNLLNNWRTTWNNIVSSAKNAGSQLVSAISGLPTRIRNLSSAFSNAGKAILDALYDSIVSGFNEAIKKAKDLLAELRSYLPSSPAEQGPFKTLPDWSSAISQPLSKSVSEAASTAKTAGTSIISSIASGIKSAASTVYNAASSAFKKVKSLLPHSPAEEGPFSEIPNWDAIFLDPMKKSISEVSKLSSPLSSALGTLRSPVDSSLSAGLNQISNISNSSTNYEGSTYSIGPNYVRNDSDLRTIIAAVKTSIADDRRRKGIFS